MLYVLDYDRSTQSVVLQLMDVMIHSIKHKGRRVLLVVRRSRNEVMRETYKIEGLILIIELKKVVSLYINLRLTNVTLQHFYYCMNEAQYRNVNAIFNIFVRVKCVVCVVCVCVCV